MKVVKINNKQEYIYVPECLKECNRHYVPRNEKYITCKEFGQIDGMDGACWWCKEMTPYQWSMCWDESSLRSLMNPCFRNLTKEEAIRFIEERKQKNPAKEESELTFQQKVEGIKSWYEDRIKYIEKDRNKYKDRYSILSERILNGCFDDAKDMINKWKKEDEEWEI